jgi:hypothetical protein
MLWHCMWGVLFSEKWRRVVWHIQEYNIILNHRYENLKFNETKQHIKLCIRKFAIGPSGCFQNQAPFWLHD